MRFKPTGVKWRRSVFGMYADVQMPKGCNVVTVCVIGGSHYELHPVEVRLPHQIYYTDCKRWLKENDATEIVLLPYNSNHCIDLGKVELRKKG